jgi:hypothetical protein
VFGLRAEGVGFEPSVQGLPTTVFETAPFNAPASLRDRRAVREGYVVCGSVGLGVGDESISYVAD